MRRVISYLTSFAGALSLILLIRAAYEISFTYPLEVILSYYKSITNFIFGWLDPYISHFVNYIKTIFYIDLKLQPHWKHFLIPMWIIVTASTRATWGMHSGRSTERKLSAIFIAGYGGVISLIASALSGAIDIKNQYFLPAVIPMFGLIIMNIITIIWDTIFKTKKDRTRKKIFTYYLGRDIIPSIMAVVICITLGFWVQTMTDQNINILIFIVFITFLSIRSLIAGKIESARHMKDEEFSSSSEEYVTASTRVGLLIIRSIGGAFLFIALDAGLNLAGIGV